MNPSKYFIGSLIIKSLLLAGICFISTTHAQAAAKPFPERIKRVPTGKISVQSVSPSNMSQKVSRSTVIKITFSTNTDMESAKKALQINPSIPGNYNISGRVITFTPTSSYAYGQDVEIIIDQRTKCLTMNLRGCPTQYYYKSEFKTESYRTVTLGASVEGRPIEAQYFGSGERKVLMIAAMHGNEGVTATLLNQFRDYLNQDQRRVPSDITLILIPQMNPDGLSRNQRLNARGVDLNRNWPTSDWQTDTWIGSIRCLGCGGPHPASEPETIAVKNLIDQENPYLFYSYHVAADEIVPGKDNHPSSISAAMEYSQYSGIRYSNEFGLYPITGDMTYYAVESRNIASVLVEGSVDWDSQFSRHLPAMLKTFTYGR